MYGNHMPIKEPDPDDLAASINKHFGENVVEVVTDEWGNRGIMATDSQPVWDWDNLEEDGSDGWTDDEEEDLIRMGLCPECGADLDICGHGADDWELWENDDE